MELSTIHSRLEKTSRYAAILGGLGVLFISAMITVDVILRKFFSTTLGGASEIAGMVFGVGTAISYPYVLLDRANIRIDVVYARIRPMFRALLDIVALIAVIYFGFRLSESAFGLLQKSWNAGSKSVGVINIPLWIPQSLWVLGFAVFTLTAVFLLYYSIVKALRRDWRAIILVAGVPSIEETIEEETYIEDETAETAVASSRNEEDH